MIVNKDDGFVKIIHFRQSFNVHFRLKMAHFTLLRRKSVPLVNSWHLE